MSVRQLNRLKTKAIELARRPALNFFELAEYIAVLHDSSPALVADLPHQTGMSRRRLYYLLDVGQLIATHKIIKSEAEEIGWTKLQIIARHVKANGGASAKDIRTFFKMARATKAHALIEVLRGKESMPARAVMFRLDDAERSELNNTLMAFGARPARRGLKDKEVALMMIIRAAKQRKVRLRS